jgi:hypothetical protein
MSRRGDGLSKTPADKKPGYRMGLVHMEAVSFCGHGFPDRYKPGRHRQCTQSRRRVRQPGDLVRGCICSEHLGPICDLGISGH